jgi:asparagine synthase (glutamine-hydrolysing)
MCGFVGVLDTTVAGVVDQAQLRPALSAIAHRGPDAEGLWTRGPIGFGHRRLSILDTSAAGTQPMHSACGRFTIVFNGEVYNFIELRAELRALGHAFTTDTDTEVIIEAFRAWGSDCFRRFNGMWAIALWDQAKHELLLCRDRFGIKPLYIGLERGRWMFGSELQAARRLTSTTPQIHAQVALDYLEDHLLDHLDDAALVGWQRLPAGHVWVIAADGTSPRSSTFYRYLDACDRDRRSRIAADASGRELALLRDELRDALRDAVRLRMRSDVPAATCLSGGIDSGAIACLAAGIIGAQRSSMVPMGFYARSLAHDEMPYVAAVAAQTGYEIDVTSLDEDAAVDAMGDMLRHHDEPLHSLMPLAGYLVFRAARRRGITVLLNGQGADEQTAGYGSTIGAFLAEVLRSEGPAAMHRQWQAEGVGKAAWIEALRLRGGDAASWFAREFRRRKTRRNGFANEALHAQVGANRWLLRQQTPTRLRAQLDESVLRSPLPLYLRIEDRNSMAHGCEARVPFLDPNVVALLATVPPNHMRRDGFNKAVLRDALRGVLPDVVRLRRDKMGFPVPSDAWLRGPLRTMLSELTTAERLERRGLYDVPAVLAARTAFLDRGAPLAGALYRVFLFEAWARQHVDAA